MYIELDRYIHTHAHVCVCARAWCVRAACVLRAWCVRGVCVRVKDYPAVCRGSIDFAG